MNNIKIKKVTTIEECVACNHLLEELIVFESKFDSQINAQHKIDQLFERTLNKEDCVIFMALSSNQPIAYIMAYKQKDNPAFNGNFITIMNLFVKENYRNYGVGKNLMSSVEMWAKNLFGDCFIELDCFVDNKTAIDFYSKQNYTPIRVKMRKKI